MPRSMESGGGVALVVQGSTQTVFAVSPTLEIGTQWWIGSGMLIRAFARGRRQLVGGADPKLAAFALGST